MKKLAMVLGSVVGLGLLFFAVVVAINALDEPLSPATQAMIKEMEIDVKPSEGYDYLLGIAAPADQDPLVAGREIREESRATRDSNPMGYRPTDAKRTLHVKFESKQCEGVVSRPVYCGKDWYQAHVKEVEKLGQDNAVLLSRFDKLMSFASLNTDPSARSLIDSNIADIQNLLRIKQDLWGLNWTLGNKESVTREWTESNRFFNRWLEATPLSLVETSIVLHLLGTQKKFALEILKEDSKAATHFNSETLLTLKPTVSFERLKNKVTASEFNLFYGIARTSPNVGSILDFSFGGGPRDRASVLYELPVPLLKWNATLNAYAARILKVQNDPCVTDANPCQASPIDFEYTINNPIGRVLVALVNPSSPIYEKMYQRYSDLSGI